MEVRTLLAGVLALGLVRAAVRAVGLVVLTGVVLATVAALTVGVLLLRLALG